MTDLNTNTIRTAAAANVTADHLASLVAQYDTTGDTARTVNAFARSLVADYAPASASITLPTIGFRGARTTDAYSGVAGGKDVAVFMGKRTIVASGVLHTDGSLTVGGETYGSPSAAQTAVAHARGKKTPRVSGWAKWLFIDGNGNVAPIEAIREGGVEQRRSMTRAKVMGISAGRKNELKAIARREARGVTSTPIRTKGDMVLGAPGEWTAATCTDVA